VRPGKSDVKFDDCGQTMELKDNKRKGIQLQCGHCESNLIVHVRVIDIDSCTESDRQAAGFLNKI